MLLRNTLIVAILGTIGAVASAVVVAYGFARFRIPGRNGLFLLLIMTIILPFQVLLIPQYIGFKALGWTGTWLPLIVPHFFANAYNVFLLRQYFLTLPRELDQAAEIDGASPLQVLWSVIIPQAWPAIIAVALFHFFFTWNDFFAPLVYLSGKPELATMTVGLQAFNATYAASGTGYLTQAAALMAMIVPGRDLLRGPARVHARRRDLRRREVAADDCSTETRGRLGPGTLRLAAADRASVRRPRTSPARRQSAADRRRALGWRATRRDGGRGHRPNASR